MISLTPLLEKGLQSNVRLENKEGSNCQNILDMGVDHKIVIKMTAVMMVSYHVLFLILEVYIS